MRLTAVRLLCLFVFADAAGTVEDDAIVIDAESTGTERDSRQFFFRSPAVPLYTPFAYPQTWSSIQTNTLLLATTGTCYTTKGVIGKCTSFRRCYPYFKFSDVNNFDSWVLGMYDTCSYYTLQGRQMFGVCCTNPIIPTEAPEIPSTEVEIEAAEVPQDPVEDQNVPSKENPITLHSTIPLTPIINVTNPTIPIENAKTPQVLLYPGISNWPPPLPTHPPDHTIPPLPTHPPSTNFPSYPSTSWPPTHRPTTKPMTQKPGSGIKPTPAKPIPTPKPPTVVTHSCGAKNGYEDQERIVGGHNAEINEWPWIAALFNGGRQFCGGSLIDSSHILSAAHCVAHMSSWDVARLTVRLGDYNIKTNSETRHVEKRVKRVVRHRGFDARTLYNDIAILTLDSPVEFTQNIRPICLPLGRSDHTGKTGTVIGWGSLRESGPQPAVLQEVSIPIWKNQDCRLKYGGAAPGGITEHMICAGQANRDSCSGDSGGPLMVKEGKWTQVGIVSWGIGCGKGQYPGVYTRVSHFLSWINKNIK